MELLQLRSKLAPFSQQSSGLCGYFLSFSPRRIFLFAALVFSFAREVSATLSIALPGPKWTSVSFRFSLSTLSLLGRRPPGEGSRVLFCHPPPGRAAPQQDRWLPGLFLTVSREEDSTAYLEPVPLIDSSQIRNILLIPDLKFNSCN